jgi:16S rRNA (adenine(1408)-N(1))-methyltransferase
VYESARRNPRKFYIGVDANPRALEKVSEKIHRKFEKGGAPNVLFVQAAVEDLPEELSGVADEVHVHFPWGSLLRGVALPDEGVLRNLRRICAAGALLEIVVGLDEVRDRSEMERLGLAGLTEERAGHELAPAYRTAGFEIEERGEMAAEEWGKMKTAWAKRLAGGHGRRVIYWVARAI